MWKLVLPQRDPSLHTKSYACLLLQADDSRVKENKMALHSKAKKELGDYSKKAKGIYRY